MLDAAKNALFGGANQYPPGPGRPELRAAIARHRLRYGTEYDPDTEILVTAGATEAIAAALMALTEAGDEVVVIEPYYDSYAAAVAMKPALSAGSSGWSSARTAGSASTSTGCGPPSRRGPGRSSSTRRTTRLARCSPAPSSRRWPHSASSTT